MSQYYLLDIDKNRGQIRKLTQQCFPMPKLMSCPEKAIYDEKKGILDRFPEKCTGDLHFKYILFSHIEK